MRLCLDKRSGLYTRASIVNDQCVETTKLLKQQAPWFAGSSVKSKHFVHQKPFFNFKFRAYTPTKAFFLNALITAFAVATGTELRNIIGVDSGAVGWVICLGITFGTAFLSHQLFYHTCLFGSGMIAVREPILIDPEVLRGRAPDAYLLQHNNTHIGPSMCATFSGVFFDVDKATNAAGQYSF